ncbi:MAG: NAD(P)H-hydrate epimerase, partial [Acidimicrobiales bacterium]
MPTVAEMRAVDDAALALTTHDELVGRAGRRLASHARAMLGQVAGRRIVVVAGKGSNGADGLDASRW